MTLQLTTQPPQSRLSDIMATLVEYKRRLHIMASQQPTPQEFYTLTDECNTLADVFATLTGYNKQTLLDCAFIMYLCAVEVDIRENPPVVAPNQPRLEGF